MRTQTHKTSDGWMSLFENHPDKKVVMENLRREGRHLCYVYTYVTSDMLRRTYPVPSWICKKIYGAVFRLKDFKWAGSTTTKVKISHGRRIGVWELTKRKEQDK